MPSFNKWIGEGNLTRDVDVRFSPNGTAIANFSLAINRKYKQDNETKEECSFFERGGVWEDGRDLWEICRQG